MQTYIFKVYTIIQEKQKKKNC